VYNISDKPAHQAEPGDLYDFRALRDIISYPGQPREVSRRTMQGFIQYILSVYQKHLYSGIYVYIAAEAVRGDAQLQDGVLPIEVVEAKISEITITPHNARQEKVERGILRSSVIRAWSPVKVGQVVNKKKLDDFVNLLNLNPDRYVSAIISRGSEPDSLALGYELYEANPWHYYIQLDNSGTEERQWAPRVGLSNTNLTGIDDRFSAVYQAPWDSGIEDNYLLFGSYESPVFTPRLRLNFYGGYSEFDTTPEGGLFNFLGRGSFCGTMLRYNFLQAGGWFFDATGSLSYERSRVTPPLFPGMGTDIGITLWGVGVSIHRSDDMSNTSFTFNRVGSMGGSSQDEFTQARQGADRDFAIYTASAAHSQYLDPNRINRLGLSFRLITSDGRLVPSKMTTFGGLYSVRGYKEDEIVADGGVLMSVQYEFDLVKYYESKKTGKTDSEEAQAKRLQLRKLAPLAFLDYARAQRKNPVPGEWGVRGLLSIGLGVHIDIGDNFSAGMYYGWPLRTTEQTNRGDGRFSFSFIYRF
jgi:hemolysin activation/secretion protein